MMIETHGTEEEIVRILGEPTRIVPIMTPNVVHHLFYLHNLEGYSVGKE